MSAPIVVAALVAVGLLAGCGSLVGGSTTIAPSTSSTSSTAIAASSAPAEPVPSADSPASEEKQVAVEPAHAPTAPLSTCSLDDLALEPAGRDGAGGHLLFFFEVRNTGHTTCRLRGYPSITETVPGRPQVLALKQDTFVPHSGLFTIALRPGDHAFAWLDVVTNTDLCAVHRETARPVAVVVGPQRAVLVDRPVAYCSMTQSAWRPEGGFNANPRPTPSP